MSAKRRIERQVRNKEFADFLENDFYEVFPKNPNFVHPDQLMEQAYMYPGTQSSVLFNFNPTAYTNGYSKDALKIMKQEMMSRCTAEKIR